MVLETECHSDDEEHTRPGNAPYAAYKEYYVFPKAARNPNWKFFMDPIDRQIISVHDNTGNSRAVNSFRLRTPAPQGREPIIPFRLPSLAPLDFYAPTWFNQQDAAWRMAFRDSLIAFPLPADTSNNPGDWNVWKNMDDDEFEREYGHKVRPLYNVGTAEEEEQARQYDQEQEEANARASEERARQEEERENARADEQRRRERFRRNPRPRQQPTYDSDGAEYVTAHS